jgi:hypothetical protein
VEKVQWTGVHNKHMDLLDCVMQMDHWKRIYILEALKKLSKDVNEEFKKQVSEEVTTKVILKDKELKKKFIAVEVDDEFNKNILKVTIQCYKNMEARL